MRGLGIAPRWPRAACAFPGRPFYSAGLIRDVWGRGLVDIRARGGLLGEGSAAEARNAARYMAKYIRKATDEDRIPGMHRYEVAQDFQPKPVFLRAPSEFDAVRAPD